MDLNNDIANTSNKDHGSAFKMTNSQVSSDDQLDSANLDERERERERERE